ncbi:MAG: hypothetical protein F6K42_07435 [Leptolyngbya sp. SIO1D8]|nr:hypothetical protein [Leptolyngbya sp. SIO1D8]
MSYYPPKETGVLARENVVLPVSRIRVQLAAIVDRALLHPCHDDIQNLKSTTQNPQPAASRHILDWGLR